MRLDPWVRFPQLLDLADLPTEAVQCIPGCTCVTEWESHTHTQQQHTMYTTKRPKRMLVIMLSLSGKSLAHTHTHTHNNVLDRDDLADI